MQEGESRKTCANAENFAEKWQRCRTELQKWFAETMQYSAPIGGAEKNGSDADAFAEEMQRGG